MIDPCSMCYLYPHDCFTRNGCKSRTDYLKLNGADENVPVVRRQKKKKVFSNEYNKNGIRRVN